MAQPIRLQDLFSARLAESHFAGIPALPPEADRSAWERRYRVLTVGMKGMGASGTVTLARRPLDAGGFGLEVEYRKRAAGNFENVLVASLVCADDPLGTPQSWRFTFGTRAIEGGEELPATRWVQEAARTAGGYTIREGGSERLLAVAGAATTNWTLLAVLGGMAGEPGPPVPLTLLDDFDLAKPGMELRGRGTREVLVGGKEEVQEREIRLEKGRVLRPERVWTGGWPTKTARHDLTGPGLVPRAYYVDQAGRVLFMAAGTEGLSLEADGPAKEGN